MMVSEATMESALECYPGQLEGVVTFAGIVKFHPLDHTRYSVVWRDLVWPRAQYIAA